MKRQNPLQYSLIVLFFGLMSCSNYVDDYQSKWCMVQGVATNLYFLADDGEVLKPSNSIDTVFCKSGERYRVLYMSLGTTSYYSGNSRAELVEVESLQRVLVKNINTGDSLKSIHGDPISINQPPFIGGGFLNFDFNFEYNNIDIQHSVELVQDTLDGSVCRMRFLHLAKSDYGSHQATALVSFPIRTYDCSVIDSLVVEVLQYDNQLRTYRIALNNSSN
jgi:hypothetical protein